MKERKVLTLRMDPSEAREAEVAARAEGVSVNEFIREALAARITERRKDESFKRRIAELIAEDREILERLAK
ncbi:MAG: toxin-antitoxin system HicB family antitoxin [Acidimicrobiales bacterium]|jgi:hypothetical protein